MPGTAHHPVRKRRRRPEERPQQILEAAFTVFGEHGLAGARLEDIARRAGIAKGTIYLYFPNKEALFKEMIRQTIIVHLERTEETYRSTATGTAVDQIRRYMWDWWQVVRSPAVQVLLRLVIGELHRFPELAEFYWTEVAVRKQQLVARIIRHGIASGEFRTIDPTVAGRMIASMFATHSLWAGSAVCASWLTPVSDEEIFEQIMDFFLRAIRPTETDPRLDRN
jgi:AcrR family transcriptional regulator